MMDENLPANFYLVTLHVYFIGESASVQLVRPFYENGRRCGGIFCRHIGIQTSNAIFTFRQSIAYVHCGGTGCKFATVCTKQYQQMDNFSISSVACTGDSNEEAGDTTVSCQKKLLISNMLKCVGSFYMKDASAGVLCNVTEKCKAIQHHFRDI
ncbi:hypothetical protein Cgig2_030866 [Carnegiea gigantea]|uniref:Uncharacterized protein n=1 Tax=Carnegiea gigantea TaxID=171969 RepID=A0A9Q1QHT5_9CARY|nr:hypothetical protein Cgig2_030866 [Carnegiea gigantea]